MTDPQEHGDDDIKMTPYLSDEAKRGLAKSIRENLPDADADQIKAFFEKVVPELCAIEIRNESHYSGPIPPADDLRKYETVYPGLAKIIIDRAGKEQQHRHAMEREEASWSQRVVSCHFIQVYVGQGSALVIAMTAILGGIYLIAAGKDATGIATIIGALVSLVAVFLVGKYLDKSEPDESTPAPE